MEPVYESPFKRDEPVSGSWKWMILAAVGGAAWLIFMAWCRYERMASMEDFLWELALFAIDAVIFGLLVRTVWVTAACRTQRNFEVMASAVRVQRPFWIVLTVAAGAACIFGAVEILQTQNMNDHVKRWIKANRAAPANPQPAANP